jgi:hypothetical protein
MGGIEDCYWLSRATFLTTQLDSFGYPLGRPQQWKGRELRERRSRRPRRSSCSLDGNER